MDTSFESDSDQDSTNNEHLDQIITEAQARSNYEEAGKLVTEEADTINIDSHEDLVNTSCIPILNEVAEQITLPYNLADFQKLSLYTLFQKKDLILLSPTGSGKVS